MRAIDRSEWKKYLVCFLMTAALLAALPSGGAADVDATWPAYTPDANAARSTIPEIYTWDLSPLFVSDEAWDEARLKLLAEIASTCNESLLSDYLVSNATDPAEKAYLLVERLETIRTTIFRQTMFAEFERKVHAFVEEGTPVTAALLDTTYRDLVQRYYGPGYTLDADDGLEWAYIPHFYFKYYVYSYATGLSSGIAIADRVKTLGEPAAEAFLAMLEGGASAPPLELLAGAGVDLTKPDALDAAMKTFEKTLDEVERIIGE